MEKTFLTQLYNYQQEIEQVPPNTEIAGWANSLICLLFPEKSECRYGSVAELEQSFLQLKEQLTSLLYATKACSCCNIEEISRDFFESLPEIHRLLQTDVDAILQGDPAAHSHFEIVRAYPGFLAICYYRIAHALLRLNVPLLPRILTEHAHSLTGIDIHPGAAIGEHFFIDHGTGIVIGETTHIGNHVKLYQGVTLGALSVEKNMARLKRHPTVEDHVVIYSNATILGGETVIGRNSIIGGNVWLTKSVPAGTKVYHKSEIHVIESEMLES
ncbi:MAG: serine acetyltransferase [Chitinophagaceae bacterium]|nr:serine acetyltransferase [Chitinophagaceae bacterium]